MKSKQERQEEAKKRQEEYNKLTTKQKLLKIDLKIGDKGAKKQRAKLINIFMLEPLTETGSIPSGTGDSINKKKKPYQKPKKS
jgi:hypothetical protein